MMNYAKYLLLKNLLVSNLSSYEKEEFIEIAEPIINHKEFRKRCTSIFPHHGNTSLGDHIIKDAILTYKFAKRYNKKHKFKKVNVKLSVITSLFHDLYTNPWQNRTDNKGLFNHECHGMTHPIEAVLNAYKWYPKYFINEKYAKFIIDEIMHHMYPYPVRKVNTYDIDIANKELLKGFKYYDFLVETTRNYSFFNFDIKKAKSIEGIIVARADKIVSLKEINSLFSFISLINGKIKKLNQQ